MKFSNLIVGDVQDALEIIKSWLRLMFKKLLPEYFWQGLPLQVRCCLCRANLSFLSIPEPHI